MNVWIPKFSTIFPDFDGFHVFEFFQESRQNPRIPEIRQNRNAENPENLEHRRKSMDSPRMPPALAPFRHLGNTWEHPGRCLMGMPGGQPAWSRKGPCAYGAWGKGPGQSGMPSRTIRDRAQDRARARTGPKTPPPLKTPPLPQKLEKHRRFLFHFVN